MNIFYIRLVMQILFFLNATHIFAKKILVTGGAGFIGSHVSQALLDRGDDVVIIDNFNNAYNISIKHDNIKRISGHLSKGKLTIYQTDICDVDQMTQIFNDENPDVVCHLAARAGVRSSVEDPYEYYRSNQMGTLTIFELAKQYNVKHIVSASSSSIYDSRQQGAFVEDDLVNRQTSPYGVTKRSGELLAYVYYHLYGISITNLRFFSVYGPRGRTDMAPFIFMNAIYHDRPVTVYGDGSVIRDFTFVEDIVDGIIRAIDIPLGYQIFNIGRGEPVVLSDFIATIEAVVGKKARINYKDSYSCDAPFTHANIDKAKELLGYQPKTSVRDGLEKMYQWYENDYLSLDFHAKRNVLLEQGPIEYFID